LKEGTTTPDIRNAREGVSHMVNPALAAATYSALNAHPYISAAGLAASTAYKYRSLAAPLASVGWKGAKAMGRWYAKRKRNQIGWKKRKVAYRKRRRVGPLRRSGRLSSRRVAIGRFLPFKKVVRMRYCETVDLNPAANPDGSVEKLIYPQQVSDPLDHNDNDHQPYQYDQAMTYYDRATVIGAKVRARLIPYTNDGVPVYWGMTLDHTTDPRLDLTGHDHDELQMMHGVPRLNCANYLHTKGNQGYTKGLNKFIRFAPKKFFKDNNLLKADSNSGTYSKYSCGAAYGSAGSLVDEPVIKLFAAGPNIGAADAPHTYFQITIDFIVVLTHKEVIAPEPDTP